MRKRIRIVTCQGSTQLLAALAALVSHEKIRRYTPSSSLNFLVIADLYASNEQALANYISQMARCIMDWAKVSFLSAAELSEHKTKAYGHLRPIKHWLYERVGISTADELYVCRDWQFVNVLFMNCYRSAEKICYGDGLGFYFPPSYHSSLALNGRREKNGLRVKLGATVSALKNRIERMTGSSLSPTVPLDRGYLCFPHTFDWPLPMPTVRVNKNIYLEILDRELPLLADMAPVQEEYGKCLWLLTSNFSEWRMTQENEVRLYVEFLMSLDFPKDSTIFLKPHPRECPSKVTRLQRELERSFRSVVSLSGGNLFFAPAELIFHRLSKSFGMTPPKVVTFGASSVALSLLFGINPVFGFGPELVRKYFRKEHAPYQIRFETDLRRQLRLLRPSGSQ